MRGHTFELCARGKEKWPPSATVGEYEKGEEANAGGKDELCCEPRAIVLH